MKSILKKDLSTLTTIPENILAKFKNKIIWCITEVVCKSIYAKEDKAEIDLGFGTLVINFNEDTIKYRFVPSSELEESVTKAVVDEENSLVVNIEKTLIDKTINVYKSFW